MCVLNCGNNDRKHKLDWKEPVFVQSAEFPISVGKTNVSGRGLSASVQDTTEPVVFVSEVATQQEEFVRATALEKTREQTRTKSLLIVRS